ncbi:MAG: 4-(cytidine 5'-diphospho)-2-C-methyl-D-erythritol kinase [Planctomycetota bacterium]|nr:4-(cytidine 5'-diphospho)-2-C-methyl-D-erythritol kinase [Planctomycetota bacterium]
MKADGMAVVESRAKLNLFLEVPRKRGDGYHDVETLMREIGLADRLACRPRDDDAITLETSHPGLARDADNTVLRAARLLRDECGARGGLHFRLKKTIPLGGGLGGGSSNGAAALRLADQAFGTGLSDSDLASLAARLGSDMPFFVRGGLALAEGRGERLTALDPPPASFPLTLFLSAIHSDTARAYAGLRLPGPGNARTHRECLEALGAGDMAALDQAAFNRFEETVFPAFPELDRLRDALEAVTGRRIHLAGSGAALWSVGRADAVRPAIDANPALQSLRKSIGLRVVETCFAVG